MQKRIELYTSGLQKARQLARTVPSAIYFCESEQIALDMALSKREEVGTLREFCGLTGWQRIVVVGMKRGGLRIAGHPCGPADVAKALSQVKWGPGREVSAAAAEKIIPILESGRPGCPGAECHHVWAEPLREGVPVRRLDEGGIAAQPVQNEFGLAVVFRSTSPRACTR